MPEAEGVIHFRADHRDEPIAGDELASAARTLAAWRRIARALGVLGSDPARYSGASFGNISLRVGASAPPPGRRRFLITGSQTGDRAIAGAESMALITRYAVADNRVESRGEVLPSSESMTHASAYDTDPALAMVIHGHAPELWRRAGPLDLVTTDPNTPYGTPEMAAQVTRALAVASARPALDWRRRVLVMGGHEDGILAVGRSPDEAAAALASALAAAWQLVS